MGLMTPASIDNSSITRCRHAHQSWVSVAPPGDDTSVTTRALAAYAFLCDTVIIEKTSRVPVQRAVERDEIDPYKVHDTTLHSRA